MTAYEMEFTVFCIENIAKKLSLPGEDVYLRLARYSNILDEYIVHNFEVLHSQSKEYIVNDIIEYMEECGVI